jgi:chemotaxis family two-component system response regulator Rcp1
MVSNKFGDPVFILLVEDNAADVRLTKEALIEGKVRNTMEVVKDGVEALAFLRQEGKYKGKILPDLILLDLNMPRMDGREVLEIIKNDHGFKRIPVVILTTSNDEQDVLATYNNHANCFITKPVELDNFLEVVRTIEEFWLTIVKLPPNGVL